MTINKAILVGRLGRDPEVRTVAGSGARVVNVTIATNERRKNGAGELIESTEWHRVVFYDKLAEIVGQYLHKGSLVYVEGTLRTRKWSDKDGAEKQATEIRATEMRMLGSKDEAPAGDFQQERAAPPAKPKLGATGSGFDDMDSDIPFVSSSMLHDMRPSKARALRRCDY